MNDIINADGLVMAMMTPMAPEEQYSTAVMSSFNEQKYDDGTEGAVW